MNSGYCHTDCGICGQQHVNNLGAGGWAEHGGNGINIDDLAFNQPKSRRCIHPGVGRDNERARQRTAD